MPRAKNKIPPKAFTLIELLVVISIISLLMSIMMPALGNAREQARRVVCGSDLRQFYLVWFMYSQNNDDQLCSPDTLWTKDDHGIPIAAEERGPHWVADGPALEYNNIGNTVTALKEGVLGGYDAVPKLYKCKSDRTDLIRSYSIPVSMGGKICSCEGLGKPFSNQSFPKASEKIIFMDAEVDPAFPAFTATGSRWLDGPFQLPTNSSQQPIWATSASGQRITLRHDNGSNYVFGDSHFAYRRWKDPRTIQFFQGQIDSAAASSNNEDLKWLADATRGG